MNAFPVPERLSRLDKETQESIYEYLKQMTSNEKIAYVIAMEHLGTSFDVLRSNGYMEWTKSKKQ